MLKAYNMFVFCFSKIYITLPDLAISLAKILSRHLVAPCDWSTVAKTNMAILCM